MSFESAFTMDTSSIKYGPGVTREVGEDVKGSRRDPSHGRDRSCACSITMRSTTTVEALEAAGSTTRSFPMCASSRPTSRFSRPSTSPPTAGSMRFVAVGGGSVIDTAKAANLYATYPADLLTYVNAPIGQAKPVPGKLKPLIAIPTTAGTGSETTGVAIFDLTSDARQDRHRAPRAASGAWHSRSAQHGDDAGDGDRQLGAGRAQPRDRVVYGHSIRQPPGPGTSRACVRPIREPIRSAISGRPRQWRWSPQISNRSCTSPNDLEARGQMMLAAAYAGIGFGNAGVHLPHGMSYPVSGLVRSFVPDGYPDDHAIVPHGMSVILNAPAVFRFTAAGRSGAASGSRPVAGSRHHGRGTRRRR